MNLVKKYTPLILFIGLVALVNSEMHRALYQEQSLSLM